MTLLFRPDRNDVSTASRSGIQKAVHLQFVICFHNNAPVQPEQRRKLSLGRKSCALEISPLIIAVLNWSISCLNKGTPEPLSTTIFSPSMDSPPQTDYTSTLAIDHTIKPSIKHAVYLPSICFSSKMTQLNNMVKDFNAKRIAPIARIRLPLFWWQTYSLICDSDRLAEIEARDSRYSIRNIQLGRNKWKETMLRRKESVAGN